jgi:hypothetical protein
MSGDGTLLLAKSLKNRPKTGDRKAADRRARSLLDLSALCVASAPIGVSEISSDFSFPSVKPYLFEELSRRENCYC